MPIYLIEMKVHGVTWTPLWPYIGSENYAAATDFLKGIEARNTTGIKYRIATYERNDDPTRER